MNSADYNKGVEDAFYAVKKLYQSVAEGGLTYTEIQELFHTVYLNDIMRKYPPQTIMNKIKIFEQKKKCKTCIHYESDICYGCCNNSLYFNKDNVITKKEIKNKLKEISDLFKQLNDDDKKWENTVYFCIDSIDKILEDNWESKN